MFHNCKVIKQILNTNQHEPLDNIETGVNQPGFQLLFSFAKHLISKEENGLPLDQGFSTWGN